MDSSFFFKKIKNFKFGQSIFRKAVPSISPVFRKSAFRGLSAAPLPPISPPPFQIPTAAEEVEVHSNFQLPPPRSLTPTPMATREGTTSPNARPPEAALPPTVTDPLLSLLCAGDSWSEIVVSGGARPQIGVVYGRRRAREPSAPRNLET
jgi:hypothetical protein